MAIPTFAPRVLESSSTTGTGSFTLTGAQTGDQSFANGCAANAIVDYFAYDSTGAWEEGQGTLSSSNTVLSRTVYASSNSGSAVSWMASQNLRVGVTISAHFMGTVLVSGGALGTPSSGTLTNCTFPTLNQNTSGSSASCTGNAATSTKWAAPITVWGQNIDGSSTVNGSMSAVGNITGGASSMAITAGTGNSRTLALQTTTSGGVATTSLTLNADQSATFANTVNATNFIGALTGNASTASAVAAGALTGATLASGVTGSSLTSFGAQPTLNVPTCSKVDTGTNNQPTILNLTHTSSGSVVNNFGAAVQFQLTDSAGTTVASGGFTNLWANATDGSQKSRFAWQVYGGAAGVTQYEGFRVEGGASGPLIGFLNTVAAAQQTGDAGTALVTFGLMSGTPTFAVANLSGTTLPASVVTSSLTTVGTLSALNVAGNAKLTTAGNGLYVKEGSNATMGVATLTLGTVTVSTTKVTASSRIFLSSEALGTISSPVAVAVTARSAGVSFTITSANLTDTSSIAWIIVEPA